MQVGEQGVARVQELHLGGLWLLNLEDQLGTGEQRLGVAHDGGPLGRELLVCDRAAEARPGLDRDIVPPRGELAHTRRGDGYAVLIGLYLGGDAYSHRHPLQSRSARTTIPINTRSLIAPTLVL